MGAEARDRRQSRYAPILWRNYDRIPSFYHLFVLLMHEITENAPLLVVSYFDSCALSPKLSETEYAVENNFYFLSKLHDKGLNQRK